MNIEMPYFDMQLGLNVLLATTVFLAVLQVLTCLTWDPKQVAREKAKRE